MNTCMCFLLESIFALHTETHWLSINVLSLKLPTPSMRCVYIQTRSIGLPLDQHQSQQDLHFGCSFIITFSAIIRTIRECAIADSGKEETEIL